MILLDWKMPGMTGIEVLRELRERKVETPVVFLTVLSDQIYEEAGLLGGAVDFIEKSRGFSILARRMELILNGAKGSEKPAAGQTQPVTVTYGDVRLHRDVNRAFWKDVQIDLTLTEFQMVDYLVVRAGRDVRYRELYDIVHGEGFAAGSGEIGFRANVRAFIKRIRQKFRDVDSGFAQIENYPGFGYRWSDSDGA
jgi:two-component system response regulator ChvI